MLKDVPWANNLTYSPGGEHTPIEFFTHGLVNSHRFDLKLGYFNSAAISVLSYGFASFIANGGKMRMAINQIVSSKDKDAITLGLSGHAIEEFDLSDLESLKRVLDDYSLHFFNCLAYLIQKNRIEIRIIKPQKTHGIAHTKTGQFYDGEMCVSFTGSANFTIGGLINNTEDISIYLSSSPDPGVQQHIKDKCSAFDLLMAGEDKSVTYLNSNDLIRAVESSFGGEEIDELLQVERKLRQAKEKERLRDIKKLVKKVVPSFPFEPGPRDYQIEAYKNWEQAGRRGFFAMATGTGKTITSLNCLLNLYFQEGSYKAIILVPTIALVNQWQKECQKFHFNNILKISSRSDWKDQLTSFVTNCFFNRQGVSFVVIATYASFAKEHISNRLFELPEETLLIADEAHNMGATSLLSIMPSIPFTRRIGLSATPSRQFDDIGNQAIGDFFNCSRGYTFEYSMALAIKKKVLCQYKYFPHIVHLTPSEMEEYMELSKKIAKFYNPSDKSFKDDPILTALLLKRKRIIHKAENKVSIFKSIMMSLFEERGSLQYSMVYVPEGNSKYDFEYVSAVESDDEIEDAIPEEKPLIRVYTEAVMDVDKYVTVEQFTSKENDRERILDDFSKGNTQVLVAMKCLDEGVDVPRAEVAIFCSSTGNPRQFIQRRGRILRTHDLKPYALIHDLVVVPFISKSSDSYDAERALLQRELKRVRDFALLSMNISYTESTLENTIESYNLNLYEDEQT